MNKLLNQAKPYNFWEWMKKERTNEKPVKPNKVENGRKFYLNSFPFYFGFP